MEAINSIMQLEEMDIVMYFLKMTLINFSTYYNILKITNTKNTNKTQICLLIYLVFASIFSTIVYFISNYCYNIIFIILALSVLFNKTMKVSISNSILSTVIALSINYIIYFIAIILSFIPRVVLNIENLYINFLVITLICISLTYIMYKTKRLKNGLSFLQKNQDKDYFDVYILNISVVIIFSFIIFSNFELIRTSSLFFGFIIFSIIMFITIQKSLQLYYKQKLLIQDLEETKKELKKKKQEIQELEKENLSFSKISHSIAHKQKSLEHKLNELMLKNEIAEEIDIKDRIKAISKELNTETSVELNKTDIPEIDDMLKYMQSECIKNKIKFELQISGNIYQMINNHIEKENLEILLADHIKNAIIAINYSNNSNKSILVRLGIIDGFYSLYIYDSGIEFEIETLSKLGKVPSTTHKESGGTGMGFMNTFDTLKKYKASMIINEFRKPCKDNYTKVIMIKFDKKNEFKIESYRLEEMRL